MASNSHPIHVTQFRLIVEADDFDEAVAFYRDALGLAEQAAFEGTGDARVAIFDVGRATLEISNPAQVAMIDQVEVGPPVSPKVRVAFEVDDTERATTRLAAAGAEVIGAPVETPWHRATLGSAGRPAKITLFEEAPSTRCAEPFGSTQATAVCPEPRPRIRFEPGGRAVGVPVSGNAGGTG